MTQAPVAIVTGAARGIGFAIAERLAADAFDVVMVDLSRDAAAEKAIDRLGRHDGKVEFVEADIADLTSHARIVEAAVAAFGRIDCLVNNAGIGAPARGDVLDLTPENFDRVIDVNLRGTVFLTQAVVRHMLAFPRRESPRTIVTITSVSAGLASPERLDYCMSKAGLAMFSQGLALRLAPEEIGVFDVRPGIIKTEMTAAVAERYDQRIKDGLVPARRWGEPRDIAGIVSSLASGDFGFATGSVIAVDGGLAIPRL